MFNGDESTRVTVWVPAGGLNPARRVSSGASGRLRHPEGWLKRLNTQLLQFCFPNFFVQPILFLSLQTLYDVFHASVAAQRVHSNLFPVPCSGSGHALELSIEQVYTTTHKEITFYCSKIFCQFF